MRGARPRFLLLSLVLCGCAGSSRVPVTGTVTLNGLPLANVLVSFHPGPGTGGLGGHGITDAAGKYVLAPSRGSGGLEPGPYTVVISRRRRPDGSLPPPNVPAIESDARETLPASYSTLAASTLRADVAKETTTYDFALRTAGKN
jgi:hypothetical protein